MELVVLVFQKHFLLQRKELNNFTSMLNFAATVHPLSNSCMSPLHLAGTLAALHYTTEERLSIGRRHTRGTYSEGVLDDLELLGGVLSVGHHFANDGFDVVHPFQVLGTTEVIHFLDEAVVLLPERHGADSPPGKRSR